MYKNCLYGFKIIKKHAFFLACFLILLTILRSVMMPINLYLTKMVIDAITEYVGGYESINAVIMLTVTLTLSSLFWHVVSTTYNVFIVKLTKKMTVGLYEEILDKLEKIPYRHFEDRESKDVMKRIGDKPEQDVINLFATLLNIFSYLIKMIAYAVIFIQLGTSFVLIYFLLFGVISLFSSKSHKMMNDMFAKQSEPERKLDYFSTVISDKHSLLELRIYRSLTYIKNIFNLTLKKVFDERVKVNMKSQLFYLGSELIIIIWLLVVFIYLIIGIENSAVSLGLFVAIVSSAADIADDVYELSYFLSQVVRTNMVVDNLRKLLNFTEISDGKQMTKHDDYQICFENVSFKYPGTDEYVLKNLSLSFNSNKSIALVGENGAGKSTIMKLLTKLYQPTEGKITVNGVNINDVHYDSLSNILSIVYQDFGKYYMTVAENVSFSKEFDEQKVTSILKHSMFRKNLSLDAQLGKLDESGVDLSGGEWQSLAIARALHSDARIICLDEPTASLDPIVESHIYQSFSEVIGSRGSIMISHRLASAIMCEEIIVIDEGSVVEKGSHQQLLDAKGLYQKMFDVQSSWYKEADANER